MPQTVICCVAYMTRSNAASTDRNDTDGNWNTCRSDARKKEIVLRRRAVIERHRILALTTSPWGVRCVDRKTKGGIGGSDRDRRCLQDLVLQRHYQ